MMASHERHGLGRWWVLIVLVIGLAAGYLLSLIPQPSGVIGPPSPERFFHVILSTTIVALLTALLVVYSKVYVDTGARFALGLLVVLGIFLFEALLTFPLLLGFLRFPVEGAFRVLPFSDGLVVLAFSIFLYLSLE
jgi:hypothetical protein